jgi:hypothetical protein
VLDLPSGIVSPTIYLSVRPVAGPATSRGFLGLAFHPDFAKQRLSSTSTTRNARGTTIVARYRHGKRNGPS